MPLRGAASPTTLTVGTFLSAVDAREPPDSFPAARAVSFPVGISGREDESARGSVSKFSSCRSSLERFIGVLGSLPPSCNGGREVAHALLPMTSDDLGASSTPVEGAKTVW